MDFALETGSAAHASHRIVSKREGWILPVTSFLIQERRKLLWLIPYWGTLQHTYSKEAAEEWLFANWKVPSYYHVTRKAAA